MKDIAIYTLTSPLHNEAAIKAATEEFLGTLTVDFDFCDNDYSDYGTHQPQLIYVRTGGTESVMKPLLPTLLKQSTQPIYLLTSGKSNSLAASMEILSYLRQQGIKGEILHGSPEYINERILVLQQVSATLRTLAQCRLGVIGEPSDWLISSIVDEEKIRERLGVELLRIPMDELLKRYNEHPEGEDEELMAQAPDDGIRKALPGALGLYNALLQMVDDYRLQGLSIRCFDLLSAIHNTGCIALAKLNSEGIVAGCEGDIPTMLSMAIANAALGVSGFQANPARINPETGEMLFAHCTIPFNMLSHYELDTHFESGIGVGVRGYAFLGGVTVFKIAGDLSRAFVAEGILERNQGEADLCRTQQIIHLDEPEKTRYFLTETIGNLHFILPSRCKNFLCAILREIGVTEIL